MPDYRLYLFDPAGRIHRAVDLACQDDATAEEHCQAYAENGPLELWERGRLVRRYPPRADSASGVERPVRAP